MHKGELAYKEEATLALNVASEILDIKYANRKDYQKYITMPSTLSGNSAGVLLPAG